MVGVRQFCLLLLACLGGICFDGQVAADSPNILLIYLDDFGWRDTGYAGSDFYETPNIDELAANSMVFDNAYSCASNCAPARACLLSGQYTPRHQVFNVGTRPRGRSADRRLIHVPGVDTLDPSIRTWAQQLRAGGYRTATMGKWHLSDDPLPYGFDINIGGSHSGGPPKGYYPPHGKVAGLGEAPAGEYLTDRLSSEAIKFIGANAERPWMLYLTHFAVHTPLQPKRELVDKYRSKESGKLHANVKMATMIEAVDQGVGRIVAELKARKLFDKTIILFYSDNGGHGPATDMRPLKGYKGTYYEGGIRVPFFAHWPGRIAAGTNGAVITGVDLYPTICELAGLEMPAGQIADGVSLVPMFLGRQGAEEALKDRAVFWHFPAYLQSTNVNDEQRDPLFRSRPCGAVRKGDWKLIQYFEDGAFELFDLRVDIGEEKNLIDEATEKAAELKRALADWQAATKAPIPAELNPEFVGER